MADDRPHRCARRPRAVALAMTTGGLLTLAWAMALSRPHDPRAASPIASGYRVNVNAAGADELALLPGVRPTMAQRIVADRDRNGPFADSAALQRVAGVGPVTLSQITPHVTCGSADASR